ncbi:MAG: hypothetical protein JXB07_21540 [Anaerolineae bacterium]|nr:hypothetical protein [Anaerolineae bacterium]
MPDLSYQSRYNCATCPTRCDGRSKTAYIFEDDVALSEKVEDRVIGYLGCSLGITARKTPPQVHGLPDLELVRDGRVVGRVEIKAQNRTFMSVERLLPESNLRPYETVALNLSDLERYLGLFQQESRPVFIVWWLRRPCIGEGYWGHRLDVLGGILRQYGDRRRFRRASTQSDVVDGVHKGVTVNYHFSLQELLPLDDLAPLITAVWNTRE